MKKTLKILLLSLLFVCLFSFSSKAADFSDVSDDVLSLSNALSDEVKNDLEELGVTSPDVKSLSSLDFEDVMSLISSKIRENAAVPFSAAAIVVSVILLSAVLEMYRSSLRRSSMSEALGAVATLCIASAVVFPVVSLINDSVTVIKATSDLMILYFPVMIAVMAFSGHAAAGTGYFGMVMFVSEIIGQWSSKFIAPMLSLFMGISVSASITREVRLSGLRDLFSKVLKWLIAFAMTLFSAMLTIRSFITTAMDSVSARAVRFTLSSFIPIVGAAVSEAYKTIQGSLNLLRTGAGVFVIIAILVAFLPIVLRCLLWMLSMSLCRTVSDIIGTSEVSDILTSVSSVLSVLFAVTVSVISVFVISTAVLISLGSGSS